MKEETKRLGNPKTNEWLPEKSRNNSALGQKKKKKTRNYFDVLI